MGKGRGGGVSGGQNSRLDKDPASNPDTIEAPVQTSSSNNPTLCLNPPRQYSSEQLERSIVEGL